LKTCGATPGGPSLDGIDVTTQTIIQVLYSGTGTTEYLTELQSVTHMSVY